ncbi:MAG TPA: glycosyltransferase family 4 protein [Polyangiaceae bacterium]|nr:glycosyltransferase family 4 protein [Polyangiaceae bacterium]
MIALVSALRVIWVVYGSLDQVSGGYIYDRLVVEQLRAMGDQVTVVSLQPNLDSLPALGNECDVVVGDELCFRELAPLFRAAPAGVKRVLLIHHLTAWEHAPGPTRDELLRLEKAAIDAADACLATSRPTADRLEHERLAQQVAVAEPGADRFERSPSAGQEPAGARIRLLFVGNIVPRKRVLELTRAFAELPNEHAELVLVGAELEPGYAEDIRALIAQAQVGTRVRWRGALDAASVAAELSLADALVLPSTLEGYGMVLSEALWAGVPIIAARVGAAETLVGRTQAGLLYEPDDENGLGARLASFVANRELRARLRRAALVAAEQLPRWRDTALAVRATLSK